MIMRLVATAALGVAASALCLSAVAQSNVGVNADGVRVLRGAEIVATAQPVSIDVDLRSLPSRPAWQPGDPIRFVPRRHTRDQGVGFKADFPRAPGADPLLADQWRAPDPLQSRAFGTPTVNFAGIGFSGAFPPDTVGDVGTRNYIQALNGGYRVFDKDGTPLTSVLQMDVLAPVGSLCRNGGGDPIVLFDESANRWLISEFPSGGNRLCVYISKSADPIVGGWWFYEFSTPSFPDYPKYGVWPNAYLVGTNESTSALYALDRIRMLAGRTATAQRFATADMGGFSFQMIQPADWEGAVVGSLPADRLYAHGFDLVADVMPGIFARHRDDETQGPNPNDPSKDYLELFMFDVDWTTPANSTLTGPVQIVTAEFDSDVCGLDTFNCFPQPGTGQTLDPVREVVMNRLQYRDFSSHESLVGNYTVDTSGADRGGLRWFELRRVGGMAAPWTLHQQGTYSPDSVNRWMGSIAMDKSGDIALAYSVADASSVFPGMRYVGRLSADPAGAMPQGEHVLMAGAAAQTGANRWGDYSALNVDPSDGCTFWFTSEYVPLGGQWATRIAAFKFDECGLPTFLMAGNNLQQNVCAPGPLTDINLTLTGTQGYSNSVSLSYDPLPSGFSGSITPPTVVPNGGATAALTASGAAIAGPQSITLRATGAALPGPGDIVRTLTVSASVYTAAPSAPVLATPLDGAVGTAVQPTLTWATSTQGANYILEIDDDSAFTSINYTRTLNTNSHTVETALASSTTFYWRVRSGNSCGNGANSAVFDFTTAAVAAPTRICFDVVPDLPIPDSPAPEVSDTRNLALAGLVIDVDVEIDIVHTYVGDLRVALSKVGGPSVNVLNRSPSSGCGGNDINARLDDEAASGLSCGTSPGIGGSARPANPLTPFDGLQASGDWRLAVEDDGSIDTGNLRQWCLRINNPP